ncbi:LysR substrate-binding domain-containing protein [Nakamurella aerolata]|uniref:LysR family transcriptional regulator n=1 Tax=Nakamurella aerolata TaxID=1656892 RepID=A0A849ACA1_9ACTN|nr:LysR family transcriptional regulator [Nakamurella aerolata]
MVLSQRMPDLPMLETLQAVARLESLSAAAAELGITQQAVSARLKALEARVGVPLLRRGPRGSALTAAGVSVVEWADRLLDTATAVDTALATLRTSRASQLRVAASLTIAEQLLPTWLVRMRADLLLRGEQPPEVILHAANSEQVLERVRAGTADLGLIETPTVPRGLSHRTVATDELVVVVAPDHPWARRRRPLAASQLARTPMVWRESGSGTRDSAMAAIGRAVGNPDVAAAALELSTTSAVKAAVTAGAGPAVLSRLALGDELRAGRLVAVDVEGLDLRRNLRAVWIGGRELPPGPIRQLLSYRDR